MRKIEPEKENKKKWLFAMRKEKRETVKEKEVRCTPEELKELIENLEEGQILEVTFDGE